MNKEIIKFTEDDFKIVLDFIEKIKWKHRNTHFKDKRNSNRRSEEELYNTILEGKLAEVALHKYFKQYTNYDISEVDFNIYEAGIFDDYDLIVNGKTISIKSSKPNSSCLLIECEKFGESNKNITLEGKEPPDYIYFVKVNISKGLEYAEICGGISFEEFWDTKRYIPRGFKICKQNAKTYLLDKKSIEDINNNIGFPLLADNYGIHIENLKNCLNTINDKN